MKFLTVVLLFLTVFFGDAFANVSLDNLTVDYQKTPLGIDQPTPHFSWQMKALDNKQGYVQKAWQVVVTDAKNQTVWDSKKVDSGISLGIEYAGQPLKPTTRYNWKVLVWDNTGQLSTSSSWFETGLMNPDISAWSGATWIGGGDNDLVLYSHYLSVFKFQFGLQLDKAGNSTKAAFVMGANDRRLMNKDLNLMGVQNGEGSKLHRF